MKYKELLEEGRGPRVPGSKGSQGPRCLKVTFKYKLDSKEGPFCYLTKKLYLLLIPAELPKLDYLDIDVFFPRVNIEENK